jgi:serine/threonine-protein kinase
MPFIEGESLRHALTNRGQLPPRDVVRILHDVVDALAYAHARGIVHRDIKPGNILTQGMHALVTDFGVAKALSEAIPLPLHGGTTSGMAIGTPAYMAPEQLAADPAADHRVDIYAVGLLAYELLTGKSPFSGNSPQATLAAQLTYVPPAPHTLSADIPPALSAIIMRCLEKQASKRHETATALLADLEALPPMSGSTPARRVSGGGRTRLLVAGAAVLAVAAWAITSKMPSGSAPMTGADTLDARDAGPGGARPKGSVGRTTAMRNGDSVRIVAETIPVFREVGDAPAGLALPLVMTRAESLAIAEAVLKRQQAQKVEQAAGASGATDTKTPAPAVASASGPGTKVFVHATDGALTEVNKDQIIAEVSRIFSDSMARAIKEAQAALARAPRVVRFGPPGGDPNATVMPPMPPGTSGATSGNRSSFTLMMAPPTDGRLRILVLPFQNTTGKREYASAAREVSTVLRAAIPADKFEVVTDSSDRGGRSAPDRGFSTSWAMRADYMLTGMISTRQDSVVVLTQIIDVRTGRFTRYAEIAAPTSDMRRAFEPSKVQVAAWLDTATTIAARRRSGQGGDLSRGGPAGRGRSDPPDR